MQTSTAVRDHAECAAERRRLHTETLGPLTVHRVHPRVLAEALARADGDADRLTILPDGSILVTNAPTLPPSTAPAPLGRRDPHPRERRVRTVSGGLPTLGRHR